MRWYVQDRFFGILAQYRRHETALQKAHRGWSGTKQTYVPDTLTRDCAVDRAGARKALLGQDVQVEETPPIRDDVITCVGRLGALWR